VLLDGYRMLYANPSAIALLRAKRAGLLIGRSLLDFIDPRDRQAVADSVDVGCCNGNDMAMKETRLSCGRENAHVEYTVSVVDHGMPKSHLQVIMRDITRRVRAEDELRRHHERLEQLVKERTSELDSLNKLLKQRILELKAMNKELETFSYSVSHDLRTPLIAVEGFTRILIEKHSSALDAKGKHYLGIIHKNTKRMTELIGDLLDFFSLGRKAIKSSVIDMEKMVHDVAVDFRTAFPENAFTVKVDPLPSAMGDKKMIRQVFFNLIGNAIKYCKPGNAAEITVSGKIEEGRNIYSIEDNGIGFPMDRAGKIFEVFERLHGSDEYEGTGIGLAIVKLVVQKHRGEVWANARENEGASFYFSLPSARTEEQ
jgi:light-regulated signal transduction histidine kinase (bacteriophytochrome)